MKNRPFASFLISILLPVYAELMLHYLIYGGFNERIVYPVAFSLALGAALFALCSLFPAKAARWIFCTLIVFLTLIFEVQLVYRSIFDEFMPLWQVSFGATAITNFWRPMLYGIGKAILPILLLLVPIPVSIVLCSTLKLFGTKRHFGVMLMGLAAAVLFHLGALGIMHLTNTGIVSVYHLYRSSETSTEASILNFGLPASIRLELQSMLLPAEVPEAGTEAPEETELVPEEPVSPEAQEEASPNEGRNKLDIDFSALLSSTDDPTLRKLDSYFAGQRPTDRNEYTGMLKDYNLIVLCCESFSPKLIDPELTPALYRLSTNGFVFNNFFGSFASNTTNGEYTLCTGLFPDISRAKSTASFYASRDNSLPFCLGNEFLAAGAEAWAYHNYAGEYYTRNITHPNMGFTFRSANDGLDMALGWPASDLEMMEKSVEDYIYSGNRFCAYYMTFSGHYQYNWDNPMSRKNHDAVASAPYSEAVKAYIACNLELEYAMEFLLEKLEEAGIADRTAIVLTNDHYPYGLSESEYNELAGEEIDTTFGRFRNSFILYVPGRFIPVDTYCSTVDILPTLLNLFDLPYDSRLLAGRDVLSPQAENFAILANKSFVTPDYGFDAATGQLISFTDKPVDESDAEKLLAKVENKFTVSADILHTDYYAHALEGRISVKADTADYSFTDIPNTFMITALDYALENDFFTPLSEEEYGFKTLCTNSEYLRIVCKLANCPGSDAEETELIAWAQEKGLLTAQEAEDFRGEDLIPRKTVALLLYRLAGYLGFDTAIHTAKPWDSPHDEETTTALVWCYEHSIIVGGGKLRSAVITSSESTMKRHYILNAVYNFYLRFLAS